MKKYTLILSLIFGTVFMAVAQQPKMPTLSELTNKNMTALEKKVKMNPTQRNIIYNYTMDLYKEQIALNKKQQTYGFNEDDVAKYYRLQNETTTKIRNILKDEQQTDYDNFIEEQLRGVKKKKKKNKDEEEEVVTGISGLKLPANAEQPNTIP